MEMFLCIHVIHLFFWQSGDGAKQSNRRGGTSLTEDLQTERERYAG